MPKNVLNAIAKNAKHARLSEARKGDNIQNPGEKLWAIDPGEANSLVGLCKLTAGYQNYPANSEFANREHFGVDYAYPHPWGIGSPDLIISEK